ncbi:DUF1109 domain-containing protein [Collimonas sp.]|jgi:hypothetical protein|uniref:DUF1109 domain-containing protein n=1 Tax=Collimonas sp. TaxID=1963772 RepID=UPI002BF30C18|nr:DUF1109 domain-containing protein [Collimonas sp.]HWW99234.1 DUF1109 domain-containing protein [Collimonas sp.]
MKTDDFVSLLAAGVAPVDRHASAKSFSRALILGGLGSVILTVLLYGVRPDIHAMLGTPLFWFKLAFPLLLGAAALLLASRLARPGQTGGNAWPALALPLLLVWSASGLILWSAPPELRASLLLGVTWRSCPFNIALLSVPSLIAVFWAMRGLAPTRLRLAGAAAGLLSGAIATVAYCLHCPEMGVPFWGAWYVLGMLIPTLAGALCGPRFLRW